MREKATHKIPIIGTTIGSTEVDGFPTLLFSDARSSSLTIYGEFAAFIANQTEYFSPREANGQKVLTDFIDGKIIAVRLRRQGTLISEFDDVRHIVVPDGPFETWRGAQDHRRSRAHSLLEV